MLQSKINITGSVELNSFASEFWERSLFSKSSFKLQVFSIALLQKFILYCLFLLFLFFGEFQRVNKIKADLGLVRTH